MTDDAALDETRQPARRKLLQVLGPGLITGASDDDPSGIATYSQAGAQFGYDLSWTLVFSYPLIAGIQEISAQIGRVTGFGIAGNLRRHYPAWLSGGTVLLLLSSNLINLGADLGAMGAAAPPCSMSCCVVRRALGRVADLHALRTLRLHPQMEVPVARVSKYA